MLLHFLMIERVKIFLDTYLPINIRPKVLVGVSGGLDSMVLVHVLQAMNVDFSIAHMNYGLRGEESNEDETFVRNYADKKGIECFIAAGNMGDLSGESIQMAARAKRYNWFHELMSKYGFTHLMTAHHLNDSLETTLLNLIKGTGIKGLVGISPQRDNLLRPLVSISKEELRMYALDNGVKWREDATNAESKYLRNKIRNKVIPELLEINPSLLETFILTNERLAGVNKLVENEVEAIRFNYLKTESGQQVLDMRWYLYDEMYNVLLSEILRPYGVDYVLAKDLGRSSTTGSVFHTDEYTLSHDRGAIRITRKDEEPAGPLSIKKEGEYMWGSWKISITKTKETNFSYSDSNSACLDSSQITFPIAVRSWMMGDEFVPLGMNGKKKISDFMIDNKIPLTLKKHIPLFETGSEIFWVGGYRIADKVKITDQTKEVLSIKITRRD